VQANLAIKSLREKF